MPGKLSSFDSEMQNFQFDFALYMNFPQNASFALNYSIKLEFSQWALESNICKELEIP